MKFNWQEMIKYGLVASLVLGNACGAKSKSKGAGPAGDAAVADGEGADSDTTASEDAQKPADEVSGDADALSAGAVKVRDFKQFYATYGVLLGIPSDNATFKAAFLDVATSLPTTSSVKGFLGSHQLAAMKLASAGCAVAYDTATADQKRDKFGIDFTGDQPLAIFSQQNRITMGKTLISKFWTRDFASISDTDADVVEISGLVEEALGNLSKDVPGITAATLIKAGTVAACSSVLASLPVSFY
jgi:hypothetical protein